MLGDDQQLRCFARTAGEFNNGIDDADVVVRQDDRQLFS